MERLFNNISRKDKKRLLKLFEAHAIQYKKDISILSTINDNFVGVLLSGKAQIIRTDYNGNRTIIEELEEGNIFGTLISSLSSSECEIITKEDTRVLIIEYQRILNTESNLPCYNKFIRNLLEITTNIISNKNKRIEILAKKTIRDKLLEYFNSNASNSERRILYLPFSYTDLADYLAVDRSAMSREIKNLKEEGFIRTNGRIITLLYR